MNIPLSFRNKTALSLAAALLLLVIILLWIYYRGVTQKVDIAPHGNDRFGLAFISSPDGPADEARYEGALAASAHWDRWPLYWHRVAESGYTGSPEDGRYDYDTMVVEEIERGLQPLVILMGTPADQAKPFSPLTEAVPPEGEQPSTENPPDISPATLPPDSLNEPIFLDGTDQPGKGKAINPNNAWAEFVFTTVERYQPGGVLAQQRHWAGGVGVRHWEVWNEPDFDMFWRGTIEEYDRLLEVAYKSIKTADPEATVLLGGLGFYEKPKWLGQFLRLTGRDSNQIYFDALSMHHYWSVYNSAARLNEIRLLLDFYGLAHIPIWITESGLSVWDDYPATAYDVSPDTPWRGTMAEQAAYVIQHAALAFYYGAERYFYFMLHDDCGDGPSSAYGLRQNFSPHDCNPAQGQPRPAYAAYQLAAEQFTADLIPLWRQRSVDLDQVAFYHPGHQSRVLVVWSTQGITATAAITATGDRAELYWIDPASPVEIETQTNRHQVTRAPVDGSYLLVLPPATNQNAADPNDASYHIGGRPYLLVERDTLPPSSTVANLPATRPATFFVTWQGEDMGSGIANYDVWVGQDDEPLERWLTDTTATQAEYTGEAGHTYHFAVRARDRAGNEEKIPTQAQASTRIVDAAATVSGVVFGPNREPVAGAIVLIEEAGVNTPRSLTTTPDGAWSTASLLPGHYVFQASAPGYGQWPAPRSVQLDQSTVPLLLTLPPLENAIVSGDFEGHDVWSHWDWAGQVDLFFQAFDGQFAARLGEGVGEAMTCPESGQSGQRWSIQQQVAIPAAGEPVLSFVHKISTTQADADDAWLEVTVVTEGKRYFLISPGKLRQASDWTLTALNLSPWRGQTVTVQFRVTHCAEQPFTVALDRVSVGEN